MKILLVDDHELFASSLQTSVYRHKLIEEFRYISEPQKLKETLMYYFPDIILMDIHMGEFSGLEMARELILREHDVKIVFLTGFDMFSYQKRAVCMGASGFINKNVSIEGLVHSLQKVMDGEQVFPHYENKFRISLTERESDILQMLTDGKTQSYIAKSCGISIRTVRNHVQSINDKFGVNSYLSSVIRAVELGIVSIKQKGNDTY